MVTPLSYHFHLAEFLRSETAARNDIDLSQPPARVVTNLRALAVDVLEPIRVAIDEPIIISSGWRPFVLNQLIGGSPNSDHITGLAADVYTLHMPLDELGRTIRRLAPSLPIKQCIYEFSSWIHISRLPLDAVKTPAVFLAADRHEGRTIYQEWYA